MLNIAGESELIPREHFPITLKEKPIAEHVTRIGHQVHKFRTPDPPITIWYQ